MARTANDKSGARALDIKIRREQALQLRLDGYSLRDIAERTGIHSSDLCRFFASYKSEQIKLLHEELFQQQHDRLTELWRMSIAAARKFVPVLGANGKEVFHPLLDNTGEAVLNEAGQPIMIRMRDEGVHLNAIRAAEVVAGKIAALHGLDAPLKKQIEALTSTPQQLTFNIVKAADGRPVQAHLVRPDIELDDTQDDEAAPQ